MPPEGTEQTVGEYLRGIPAGPPSTDRPTDRPTRFTTQIEWLGSRTRVPANGRTPAYKYSTIACIYCYRRASAHRGCCCASTICSASDGARSAIRLTMQTRPSYLRNPRNRVERPGAAGEGFSRSAAENFFRDGALSAPSLFDADLLACKHTVCRCRKRRPARLRFVSRSTTPM